MKMESIIMTLLALVMLPCSNGVEIKTLNKIKSNQIHSQTRVHINL